MTMNNTPLKWNNKTAFVPSKSPEKTMTTFDHLENAEKELRSALKSTSSNDKSYQLRRIVELIGTVEDIKRLYKPSSTFNVSGNFEEQYGAVNYFSTSDTINFGAAQPVNISGSLGNDVITF